MPRFQPAQRQLHEPAGLQLNGMDGEPARPGYFAPIGGATISGSTRTSK